MHNEQKQAWLDTIDRAANEGRLSVEQRLYLVNLTSETYPDENWGSLEGDAAGSMAHISQRLLPEVKEHMYAGFQHYGDNHVNLGIKGQFADIWRKIQPLKRALWEDRPLRWESPREICLDLIGHLLLTIRMIDQMSPRGDHGMVAAEAPAYSEVQPGVFIPDERVAAQDPADSGLVMPGMEWNSPWYKVTFITPVGPAFFQKVLRVNEQVVEEARGVAG